MPHIPEDSDPNNWHRYFAMECNNRAWQLAVQSRTHEENLEMLNAAHAAAIAGDSQLHRQSYDAALPAIDAIVDEEDRKIVLQTFEQVPRP